MLLGVADASIGMARFQRRGRVPPCVRDGRQRSGARVVRCQIGALFGWLLPAV